MALTHRIISLDQSARYHIQVVGRLSEGWADHFNEMELSTETLADGVTLTNLTGVVTDQARLHGILRHIRDLGLPLVLVELIKNEE